MLAHKKKIIYSTSFNYHSNPLDRERKRSREEKNSRIHNARSGNKMQMNEISNKTFEKYVYGNNMSCNKFGNEKW